MSFTDFAENRLVDFLFRQQPLGIGGATALGPSTLYVGLLSVAPTDSALGTEVTGGGYARVAVPCSLAAWAGTQSDGSTAVSSGTSGKTSNNTPIVFPTPTASWGTYVAYAVYGTQTGGQPIFYAPLAAPRTTNAGDDGPQFRAGALTFTLS
jgi:hypothetical protein